VRVVRRGFDVLGVIPNETGGGRRNRGVFMLTLCGRALATASLLG
jgi:hypothetical protein